MKEYLDISYENRWLSFITEFNVDIRFLASELNQSDIISRALIDDNKSVPTQSNPFRNLTVRNANGKIALCNIANICRGIESSPDVVGCWRDPVSFRGPQEEVGALVTSHSSPPLVVIGGGVKNPLSPVSFRTYPCWVDPVKFTGMALEQCFKGKTKCRSEAGCSRTLRLIETEVPATKLVAREIGGQKCSSEFIRPALKRVQNDGTKPGIDCFCPRESVQGVALESNRGCANWVSRVVVGFPTIRIQGIGNMGGHGKKRVAAGRRRKAQSKGERGIL